MTLGRERVRRIAKAIGVDAAVAFVAFALGLAWRWLYVFRWHRPTDFVYSDMGMYVGLAKRFAKPGYQLKQYDVTHPPGLSELISYFHRAECDGVATCTPTFAKLITLQFAVTALVPVAVGAFAWLAFDRRAGLWSLAVASLYFPFIDYGGYFLAEIYITLTATVTLVCYFGALRLLTQSTHVTAEPATGGPYRAASLVAVVRSLPKWRIGAGLAVALFGGFVFSLSLLMKMVAAPAMLAFFGIHIVLTRASTWKVKAIIFAVMMVAAMPLSKWQADRCTAANGSFCPGSNKAGADFLMGHIGRVQTVSWGEFDKNGKYRVHSTFGSPAAYQHGYTKKVEMPFRITDNEKNNAEAWRFIKKYPGQATVLSFEHVWDSFGGSLPWPTVATKYWAHSQLFHYLFLVFLLLPSMCRLIDVLRASGVVGLLRSTELAVFAPIIGVIVSVMIATGEARYRIPWDMCFILLAVQFYRSIRIRFKEAVPEPAPNVAPEPQPEPEPEPMTVDAKSSDQLQ